MSLPTLIHGALAMFGIRGYKNPWIIVIAGIGIIVYIAYQIDKGE